jgi:hypothetical protein
MSCVARACEQGFRKCGKVRKQLFPERAKTIAQQPEKQIIVQYYLSKKTTNYLPIIALFVQ